MSRKTKELEAQVKELHQKVIELNALCNEYLPDMENYRQERDMQIEINKARVEIRKQENLISAHAAQIGSKFGAEKQRAAAKKFIEGKIPDINRAIQEAMHHGKRYTEVVFSCNDGQMVGEELRAFLKKSGYTILDCLVCDRVVKIEWCW